MMNKSQLQGILAAPFDLESWRKVLFEVFGAKNFHQQPQPISLPPNNNKAESAYELGSFNTADDRLIGLYQVNVLPNVWLERNKVGLRELLRHVYKYDVDGALIVFVQDEKWRLSFVSEIRAFDEDGNLTTVATEPKRYTYLLGKDEKTKTPVDRLYSLAGKPITLEDIRNAFSVEALNEEFYKIVAQHFYQLVGATAGKGKKRITYERILQLPGIDPATNESNHIYQEFAVRLIGRIIFSWFLKMKKSDAGVPLLPEELLSSQAVKKFPNYYHTILERLFFQILNTPIEQRLKNLPEGSEQIPFLNGGLFEPHPDDFYVPHSVTGLNQNLNTLKIPDEWFFNFFQELEKYNFTIDENSVVDVEISVDPEMLGRIFENLLAEIDPDSGETARKATGSYYTPREIVDYMATESLLYYLNSKTDIDIEKLRPIFKIDESVSFPQDDREKILDALDKLNVLDPACGSGAFPIGVMQKIVMALQKLDPDATWWKERQIGRIENAILRKQVKEKLDKATVEYARKLGIIQNSLFGVDIQPIAAEISKLRCFLTLIVDENIDEEKPNRGVEPLPNLEFKFVTANTLIPLPKATTKKGMGFLFDSSNDIDELQRLRKKYLQSYGKEKEEIRTKFLSLQTKIFQQQIQSSSATDERALKISSWNPFDHSRTDWFDPEWMFGEKDFDIVIGNPPYLKERDNKHIFKIVNESEFGKKYHQGKMDYWYYFLHKAIDLVREKGIIAYITSRYWLNSSGAKKLINRVKQELSFVNLVDIGKLKVFSVVAGHHMVAIYKKQKFDKFIYKKLINDLSGITSNINNKNVKIKILNNEDIFRNNEIVLEQLQYNKNDTILLGDITYTSIGVQESPDKLTSKMINSIKIDGFNIGDGVFVLSKKEIQNLNLNDKEKKIIKKYLDPSDVGKYKIEFKEKYLIYSDKVNKEKIRADKQYINIKTHLDKYKPFITSSNKPYGLHRPRQQKYFENPKIIFKNMFVNVGFALDINEKYYFGFSFSSIIKKDPEYSLKYILSILNSSFAQNWFYKNGKKRGAGVDIGVEKLRQFPIKKLPPEIQSNFSIIVDYIIFLKNLSKSKPIDKYIDNEYISTIFEDIIDAMVLELYYEENFKKAGISIISNINKFFPSIECLSEEEKIKTIQNVYQKLRQKDNEIMNNLKLMNIRLADLIGPIKAVG